MTWHQRDDLPWLRRRTLRTVAPAAPAPAPAARPAPPTTPPPSAPPVQHAGAAPGRAPDARPVSPPAAQAGSTTLDLSRGPSTSLDLSTPAVPPPASGRPATLRQAAPATPSGTTTHAARERPRRPSAADGDEVLVYTPRRPTPGRSTTLAPPDPTVALTRLQSGVGALTVRAAVPASVGDLRLAVAYALRTGESSLLSAARGAPLAPPHSRRPVISGAWEGVETLRVDLRQVTALERFVVLAFSQSGAALAWGGALVVETYGGARLDVPLDHDPAAGVLAALSVYAVAGELVLRAEHDLLVGGTLRDAARAYGFDRITWVDPWTALT